MAEVISQSNSHGKKKSGYKGKKLSTRIDLTPMVDLGFLLITFFIFTTSMTKPKAMHINLPLDSHNEPPSQVGMSQVITLILVADNQIYYYFGDAVQTLEKTNFGADGLRHILLQKKADIQRQFGTTKDFTVLIKPSDASSYQNIVDILDEMQINAISKYMMLDLDEKEQIAIVKK